MLMDDKSSLISLPFKLGNLIGDESVFTGCVDIAVIDLIANTTTFLSEPSMTKLPLVPLTLENRNSSSIVPHNGVVIQIESNYDKSSDSEPKLLIFGNAINQEPENKDLTAFTGPLVGKSNGTEFTVLEANLDIEESKRAFESPLFEVSEEMKITKLNSRLNLPPLWGLTSICGRRSEMEDSVVALPRFLSIPSQMLSENPPFNSIHQDLTAHVFGVYDGHGGCQVANHCQENMHLALAEEIGIAKENLNIQIGECILREQWVKIFINCFQKLDDEVGGFRKVKGDIDFVAPDSVGSTAVVAILCPTHIIVANCGDSRAVLCRGKTPMPLSIDHKPNREDECARIEAAGGKVINWDGYRVSGVLAMSRSIGDRYLRPYVIADPEIMFVPRVKEDECLILASDGLWDVMTNEEACDLARKRILLWHKKNSAAIISKERGEGIDLAAQDASNYLSQIAFQRGSRDNISVIVVDLKAQRRFKKKT
ncbi:hypothetical protein RD792_005686 [Penstemon davidsonii]|uniref:protein-serine/threonine phosphatase n=1 Tax=Penstemon davidsonii TaxID=160366 RepID=A0ABR0DEI6_9LAMI|nr:hypothetical protein RD792_005686 [Penstemon davidsonii]